MMTKGMKTANDKKSMVEDKATNIKCSKCGDVVGTVAAGFTVEIRNTEDCQPVRTLCKCGNRMTFYIKRG